MRSIVLKEIGRDLSEIHHDGLRDCEHCDLPMTPIAESGETVTLECANRHRHAAPLPTDPAVRELVRSWIARRGAQLHTQHERWESQREGE